MQDLQDVEESLILKLGIASRPRSDVMSILTRSAEVQQAIIFDSLPPQTPYSMHVRTLNREMKRRLLRVIRVLGLRRRRASTGSLMPTSSGLLLKLLQSFLALFSRSVDDLLLQTQYTSLS
jgi:hypothetical protein